MKAITAWTGCYETGWGPMLVPDAYAHPAKMAFGLAERIYGHLLDRGYVRPGDTVLDPFGGVAGTAYHAMANGLLWLGVELEPKFVELGNANLRFWAQRWGLVGGVLLQRTEPVPQVLQDAMQAACEAFADDDNNAE